MRTLALAPALLLLIACEPPPLSIQIADFQAQVQNHFMNLNTDAEIRRMEMKDQIAAHHKNPLLPASVGLIVSRYEFEVRGGIIDAKCSVCDTHHLAVAWVGKDVYCPRCGGVDFASKLPEDWEKLYGQGVEVGSSTKLPMFVITEKIKDKPIKATVRYIRHTLAYDADGRMDVPKTVAAMEVDEPEGFHRQGVTYVGKIQFEYRSSRLVALGPATESPVRPWKSNRRKRTK